jgi:sialic acid synthase SpsE
MLIPKRPGTGVSPDKIDLLLGRSPRVAIAEDEMISWEMFF